MRGISDVRRALWIVGALALMLGSGCRPLGGLDDYEPCVRSTDCDVSSDGCFAVPTSPGDAICSRSCFVDTDCAFDGRGSRGACLDFSGGSGPICFETCRTNFDCPTSYTCQDTSGGVAVCLPGTSPPVGAAPYEDCSVTADCDTRAEGCFTISAPWPGGTASDEICTSSCSGSDADCPFDMRGGRGACLSFDGGGLFSCFERCRTSADCRTNFVCTDMVGSTRFTNICLPM